MTDSKPCIDVTPSKEECRDSKSSNLYCGDTQFTAGDCVSLPCDGAQSRCYNITWLFTKKNTAAVALVEHGKVKSEKDTKRLRVTETCSLEVKTLREEDEGQYDCRDFSSGSSVDRAWYNLHLISTSTTRPTTTTVKANTIPPSTSKPTTTTVKARTTARTNTAARILTSTPNITSNAAPPSPPNSLKMGLSLGIAAVLLVALVVLLILWHRRRGNKTSNQTIGLTSTRAFGDVHDEHLCVDGEQDGGPTYASIVLPEGQRAVGTAQVEDHSVTYTTVRASSRVEDQSGDVDAPYATVIDTHNNKASG